MGNRKLTFPVDWCRDWAPKKVWLARASRPFMCETGVWWAAIWMDGVRTKKSTYLVDWPRDWPTNETMAGGSHVVAFERIGGMGSCG